MPPLRAPLRTGFIAAGLLVFSLLSCGREPTSPVVAPANVFHRAASLAVSPQYDLGVPSTAVRAALSQVAFERVHIVLHNADGSVALDTVVNFPAGADSLTLTLNVPLPAGTPSTGVPLSLNLDYVNAAGQVVFSGGPLLVMVVPSSGTGSPPAPMHVPVHYTGTGASATRVAIAPKTAGGNAGQSVNFTAQALGADGQPIAGTPIVFSSSNASVVRISDPSSGSATLIGRGTAKVYAHLLTGPSDSALVTVTLPASSIALVSGNTQTAPTATRLPQPIVAKVTASDGVGVGGVTVNFAVATGGGSAAPASAVSAADGTVSTAWELGSTAGTQSLSVTASGLTGSPLSVTATATVVTPTKLIVVSQPANGIAGSALSAVSVAAQDANGLTVAAFTGDVTVELGTNPGSAALGGTTTAKALAGIATFPGLTVNKVGTGYALKFTSSGLTAATSSAFNISAGNAAKLVFSAMPASVDAGIAIAPAILVTAQDSAGNPVTSFTGAVTVAIGANPGGATLSGTMTRSALAGVATFDNLKLEKKGVGYTLTASATGTAGGSSSPFSVSPGPASALIVLSGGGQTAQAGTALAPIGVQLQDAFGNGVAGVTLSFAVASGGGTLRTAAAVTDSNGQATLMWTLGSLTGVQSISVSATGVARLGIAATASAPPQHLTITTAPTPSQTAGVTLAPNVVVQARDVANALVSAFTGAVSASVATGPAGATIGGTASVNAVAGVATFSALRLTKAGTYTIAFSASGFASATSGSVVVNAAPASVIAADSGNAQVGTAGAALAQRFVVLVTDSVGNPVSGRAIAWGVASGGGSLDSTATVTNAQGRTRARLTLGIAGGANSVTATSAGLTGSPVTFTASSAATVASTLVSPHVDTIISLTATFALAAQARDASLTNMAGTFAWVSRNPAFASVNASGLVTAVANGSTYVVATETGGTKDSALIVVQQRIATINVTPGTRSIYKTRTFQFSAAAVDGMSRPMVAGTAFSWSSSVPSVATVDTSGFVTAVTLGTTQVRATSGAITGVSTVTVITPITRIVVGRDSSSVPVTDTTSLPSLGIGRAFAAQAHDTLDAVMTGVTFAWASTNTSVALLDTTQAARAHALTNANGNTTIQATADGVTGSATLKVQQVLASIELTPTPDTIGVTGTVQVTARGKDANSRYISGGTFTYASATPAVATVNAVTGAVTGISLGSANITATSGAITSNNAVVIVSTTVPPIISFGRDTLTVGRGSSTSIPILLSRPNASAVTVNLSARDTVAYFSPTSVVIPPGTTAVNVTLFGRNAGTTQIYALDGSGTGFKGDTAAAAVQANMRMATTSWSLNAGDQVATQVLLSDPSPAGGTFVTFSYGTPGKAQVSPDPAFIPAGQLASNVVITALGSTTGSSTITPVATGVNGTASTLLVSAPVLSITAGPTGRLGAGQFESGWYVYTPNSTVNSIPLTFTSSDANVVTVTPAAGAIPGGSSYLYFVVSGKAAGTANVTVSSPGWTPYTLAMTITSPRTTICCGTTLNTTSPATSLAAYATDSLGTGHYRTSSLALTISSSDTTVVKIVDKNPVIPAGQYYVTGVRYQPGGAGGTAYVKVVAGGHAPDSMLVTVVGPKLEFIWCCTNNLGVGQYDTNPYVYTPNSVAAPLTVTITNSNSSKATTPATVTIPLNSWYAYFNVAGLDTGLVTLIASAPGYQGDTAYYRIMPPRVTVCCGTTLNNFGPGTNFTVYSADSLGGYHNRSTPLAVTLRSTNPAVIALDSSTVTIPTAGYYHNTAHISVIGIGTAYIVATAPGHRPDSTLYTVQTPKLNFSLYSTTVGVRQFFAANSYYLSTPDNRPSPLAITVTQTNAAADSLSATAMSIGAGTYYVLFGLAGHTTGVDTLIASAPGYLPDTAFVTISKKKMTQCCMPATALTTNAPSTITVSATDSIGTAHTILDTLTLHVTSSDTTVIKPTSAYVKILPTQYYVSAGYSYFGPGTASLTFTDSAGTGYGTVTTGTVTVTGPSLIMSNTNAMYGMRQHGGPNDYYVYTQNNVVSAVTVHLVSTDTRVATVPASVTIPAGSYYAYFTITAMDTIGTVQVQATATGFGPPTPVNVQVTQPKFTFSTSTAARTTSGLQSITIYSTDANGTPHYANENVTITLASSAPSVASVDSATITLAAGTYYHNTSHWLPGVVGTSQLTASDARAALYKYNSSAATLSVATPSLSLSWGSAVLGKGQYLDQATTCCYYVSTQDNMTATTTVTLGHVGTAKTTIPATTTIPSASYYSYFRIIANTFGTDTITAAVASPFHNPTSAYIVIDSGRVDTFGGWPAASMHVGDSLLVTLYTRDQNQGVHPVAAATTFTIATNSNIEIRQSNAVVTSVTVPADASQVQFYVKALTSGTGTASFVNANYHTYAPPNVTVIP